MQKLFKKEIKLTLSNKIVHILGIVLISIEFAPHNVHTLLWNWKNYADLNDNAHFPK